MRPVRQITPEEENWRSVPLVGTRFITSQKDPVEPEPVGTIILKAFRITGYDQDCDGSLMARLAAVDKDGNATGWTEKCIGLYPDTAAVVTPEELKALFE